MDEADRSFSEEEGRLNDLIRLAKAPSVGRLSPVGYCHSCCEDVEETKLFCNNRCADTHSQLERRRVRH